MPMDSDFFKLCPQFHQLVLLYQGKVRDEIERYILHQYAMEKHPNGVDYTLTIPYETDEQLEQIIYRDILQEAASTADARYCFIEADVSALDDSGRHW